MSSYAAQIEEQLRKAGVTDMKVIAHCVEACVQVVASIARPKLETLTVKIPDVSTKRCPDCGGAVEIDTEEAIWEMAGQARPPRRWLYVCSALLRTGKHVPCSNTATAYATKLASGVAGIGRFAASATATVTKAGTT